MKRFAGYALLVVTVIAPFELRAELLNQVVTINHGAGIRLLAPSGFWNDPENISDGESFTNEIGVGQGSAGVTSALIDRRGANDRAGLFEASARSVIDFGGSSSWGTYRAGFSASDVLNNHYWSYSIGAEGELVYGFNSDEAGTLNVKFFENSAVGVRATISFYDSQSGLSYIEVDNGVFDIEFNYSAQTPLISAEGPFYTQKHALTIYFPGVGGVIPPNAGDRSDFAESSFIWGHGVLPGSTPDVPLLPSGITDDGGFIIDVITEGTAEDVVYIDPVMAIGYDYESASIAFRSVLIPGALPGGDDTFELLFGTYAFTLTAGIEFDFTSFDPDGIFEFSIRGIDPGELLDPSDPTAFVTGVTFMEAGISEVIMTPVTVPEVPSALLALFPILMGVVVRFLGKRQVSSASNA